MGTATGQAAAQDEQTLSVIPLLATAALRPLFADFRSDMREGRFCAILFRTARNSLIRNGEMSAWSIEHAWKLLYAIPPEHLVLATKHHVAKSFHIRHRNQPHVLSIRSFADTCVRDEKGNCVRPSNVARPLTADFVELIRLMRRVPPRRERQRANPLR